MAGTSQKEVKLKEYRYTGKEKDDATGLYYFGARYYASWLGRWLSADPLFRENPGVYERPKPKDREEAKNAEAEYMQKLYTEGLNLYGYVKGNPVRFVDPSGYESESTGEAELRALAAANGINADLIKALVNAFKANNIDTDIAKTWRNSTAKEVNAKLAELKKLDPAKEKQWQLYFKNIRDKEKENKFKADREKVEIFKSIEEINIRIEEINEKITENKNYIRSIEVRKQTGGDLDRLANIFGPADGKETYFYQYGVQQAEDVAKDFQKEKEPDTGVGKFGHACKGLFVDGTKIILLVMASRLTSIVDTGKSSTGIVIPYEIIEYENKKNENIQLIKEKEKLESKKNKLINKGR